MAVLQEWVAVSPSLTGTRDHRGDDNPQVRQEGRYQLDAGPMELIGVVWDREAQDREIAVMGQKGAQVGADVGTPQVSPAGNPSVFKGGTPK